MTGTEDAAQLFDVAIIGGGLVGASLALALRGSGLTTLLVESSPWNAATQPSFDDRTTALGNASRRIFQALGVWEAMAPQAAAIRSIHVSDAGRFGFARLRAGEQGIEAFGYVVTNRVLGRALWQGLEAAAAGSGLELQVPGRLVAVEREPAALRLDLALEGGARSRVRTRLAVAADGAQSALRTAAGIPEWVEDYAQVAIVAHACSDRPNDGTAYERFTREGPLAVLPLAQGGYGIVWACARERAEAMLALSDADYLTGLQQRFGWRAGRWLEIGRRAAYPLALTRPETSIAPRTVLIGNAAQALHPVAGQGFNLGLRDAAMLAEVLFEAQAQGADCGAPEVLERFARARAPDRSGVVRFTDTLVRTFGDARPGVGLLRDLGLLAFDLAPPAKRALARVSAGFGGPTPRLARGLPLRGGT